MRPTESPTIRTTPSPPPPSPSAERELPPTDALPRSDATRQPLPELPPEFPRVWGYDIVSLIGSGGMGVVYQAWQRELRRPVALKMLRGEAVTDPEFRERFRQEAEAVARLQHPNIIQVFEVGTVQALPGELQPAPFIALEYVDGGSLARRTDAPQPPREAARVVEKLARAAHAAHLLGIVHRDLKPANVLLTTDGEPKIADFGVAKRLGGGPDAGGRFATLAGVVVGTPEYMAPEQVSGQPPTPALDTYALGVILYELLTARVPFQGATPADTMYLISRQEPVSPRRLQPGLPRDLETICLKCLEKNPAKRYESAEALADDLARWADGRTIRARPVGAVGRVVKWAGRNPTVAALWAAVILVGLAGVAGVVWKWREARTHALAAEASAAEAREHARLERWERYRAAIVAAAGALRLHDVAAAHRALEAAPDEFRNWEWRFLSRQLDASRSVLGGTAVPVSKVSASAHGERVATVHDDGGLRVWDVAGRREVRAFLGERELDRLALSPDGRTVAYIPWMTDDRSVILRDVDSGRVRAVLRGHEKIVATVHWSPDGTRLATGSDDLTVRVWDAATGNQLLVMRGHEAPLGTLAYSPDGKRIASPGSRDRTVRVWDAETGAAVAVLRGHEGEPAGAAFSPKGDRLLTGEGFPNNTIRLWDIAAGTSVVLHPSHANQVKRFVFSRDGSRIATCSMDQTVRLWDGVTGRHLSTLHGHAGWVEHAEFSPDGTRLATSAQDSTVRVWDVSGATPPVVLHGHTGAVYWLTYSPDGGSLVSAAWDGTVRTWELGANRTGGTLTGHEKFVYSVALHPDGNRAASAAWDGTVRLWDLAAKRQTAELNYGDTKIVSSVALHPGGRLVATLGRDDAVRLWDVDTGRELHRWPVPTKHWRDTRLAFSPRGDLLAAGGYDHAVRLWDVNTRAEVAVLRGHRDSIRDVAFSPDGKWLASAGDFEDRTVRIWDVAARAEVRVLEGHTDGVYSLAFNAAGTRLASGSTDGTVRLWDAATWGEVAALKHGAKVYGLAFTPDGSRLASACSDNTIRLWSPTTFQEVAELRGHRDYVHAVAFTRDGARLVSGSGDMTLRIWDASPGK